MELPNKLKLSEYIEENSIRNIIISADEEINFGLDQVAVYEVLLQVVVESFPRDFESYPRTKWVAEKTINFVLNFCFSHFVGLETPPEAMRCSMITLMFLKKFLLKIKIN